MYIEMSGYRLISVFKLLSFVEVVEEIVVIV